MILRYYGHSLFTMTLADGTVVATHPYGDFYTYPKRTIPADVCTVSHQHHDHNAVTMISDNPQIVDTTGAHLLSKSITVTGVLTDHDEQHGTLRGKNIVFIVEADGLRVAHLGDLGHLPTEAQAAAIGQIDVLLVPVGGFYTIDAATAVKTIERLKPRIAIPMHYKTQYSLDMPIETEQPFLRLMNVDPEPMQLCRITKEDLSERPGVLLMKMMEA